MKNKVRSDNTNGYWPQHYNTLLPLFTKFLKDRTLIGNVQRKKISFHFSGIVACKGLTKLIIDKRVDHFEDRILISDRSRNIRFRVSETFPYEGLITGFRKVRYAPLDLLGSTAYPPVRGIVTRMSSVRVHRVEVCVSPLRRR